MLSDAASGIISRITVVRVFIKASKNFKSSFLNNKYAKKFKTIGDYIENTDLIFKVFKKIIHLVTLSLKKRLTFRLMSSKKNAFPENLLVTAWTVLYTRFH